ncbi:2Fe-2S iron-sulfur cluster-binding protein [Streptomyces aureus]
MRARASDGRGRAGATGGGRPVRAQRTVLLARRRRVRRAGGPGRAPGRGRAGRRRPPASRGTRRPGAGSGVAGRDADARRPARRRRRRPFSCREGACSACCCRVTKGEVTMARNEILDRRDLDEGYVLALPGAAGVGRGGGHVLLRPAGRDCSEAPGPCG